VTALWLILKGLPWKQIATGLAALGLAVLIWVTLDRAWSDLPKARRALETAQVALDAEVACKVPSQCAARQAALVERQKIVSENVVQGYENELKSLRDRPISVRTVRLCPDARAGGVPGSRPASGPDGRAAAPDVLHGQADQNPDIGPDLYRLAADADEVAARLRGLQGWNRALSAASQPPTPPATR
jgi:hypothetical protein